MAPSTEIRADASVPAGNAHILSINTDSVVPEVHFAALAVGSPEAIWFHFRVLPPSGGDAPVSIRCIMHFYEVLLGNSPGDALEGFHPVFRTESRNWTRCMSIEREVADDGQVRALWEVPGNEGEIRVALSYPYGQSELDQLVGTTSGYWTPTSVGVSESGALLQRLYNHPGQTGGNKPGIYCIARQHAAETPGSWVLDGFLRHIADCGEMAPLVWAVPFADPDAVFAGQPGKDSFPWDFNRAWGSKLFPADVRPEYGSHPMRHEVKCLQHDLVRWRGRCQPCLVLDFHAPVTRDKRGIFSFLRDLDADGNADAAHAPWVSAIEASLAPHFRANPFVYSGRYQSRWNTARIGDFVIRALGLPMVTIETPYANATDHTFTIEDYQSAGRQIAGAVMTYSGSLIV